MHEQWIKWSPRPNLEAKYYLDDVSDSGKKLRIVLSGVQDKENKIQLLFNESVYAYRNTNESFRAALICELDKHYGKEFYGDWTFFKVKNSNYTRWLAEQAYEVVSSEWFIHLSLITVDAILDIATTYEPIVELLEY